MDKYERRFWSRVNKGSKDECWEWIGGINQGGYGQFWDGETTVPTSRYVWRISHGPIPEDMYVLHHCDNRKCVNPNHLFLGTQMDNVNDMIKKGRQRKGETSRNSKLTAREVIEIRTRYKEENITQWELSKDYPVGCSEINVILNRKAWKHI